MALSAMAIDLAARLRATQFVQKPAATGREPVVDVSSPSSGWRATNGSTRKASTGAQGASQREAPSALELASGRGVLELGMTGESVLSLQRVLGTIADGTFGATTLKALKAFQAKAGLPETGVVNQATQRALDASAFKTPKGFTEAPSLDAVKSGTVTLTRGMAGQAVADLQRRLNAAGLKPPLVVDGKFGPFTQAALKSYQQAIGISLDGALDAKALGTLEADIAAGTRRPMKPYFEEAMKHSRSGLLERRLHEMYDAEGNYRLSSETKFLDEAVASETSADRADLARAAIKSALANRTVGKCARGVRMALAQVGVHEQVPSAYLYANRLAGRRDFQEINVPDHDLSKLPAGCVVVYGRSRAHPDGHVTVSLGGGKEASDHIQRTVNPTRYGDVRVFVPVGA